MKRFRQGYKLLFGLFLASLVFPFIYNSLFSSQITVKLKLSSNVATPLEFFYAWQKDRFVAEKSIRNTLLIPEKEIEISIPVNEPFRYFRIDIGEKQAIVKIFSIEFENSFASQQFLPAMIFQNFVPNPFISFWQVRDNFLELHCNGIDPYLYSNSAIVLKDYSLNLKKYFKAMAFFLILILLAGFVLYFSSLIRRKPLILCIFSIILFSPFLLTQARILRGNSADAKPVLADSLSAPTISAYDFVKDYNDNFTETFSLRNQLILSYSYLKYFGLGVSSNLNSVTVGKDNWLFFLNDETRDYFENRKLFSDDELKLIADKFIFKRNWCRERGSAFYLVFPLNKENVYPEKVPSYLKLRNHERKYNQLISYLKSNTDLKIIEIEDYLKIKKRTYELYYPHDSHWNHYGGFFAYQKIMEQLRNDFPQLRQQHSLKDYQVINTYDHKGDLMRLLSLDEYDINNTYYFKPKFQSQVIHERTDTCRDGRYMFAHFKVHSNTNLPRLITINDSYFNNVMPFTQEHFSTSIHIQSTTQYFYYDLIDAERPEIVLMEVLERFMDRLPVMN